ncbi:hypothetical protein [Arhodomonas sp. AD133]|uniref:hypothetical protein n=1 Tax=Arhodomonas sp. AD133 TaxID=3415009 RepID=UPI003EBB6B18
MRISLLVVIAAGAAGGGWGNVAVGAMSLLAATALCGFPPGGALLSGIYRVRWLLLSIIVFYGWFTPGASGWMPSIDGLWAGAQRAAILMLMVVGARALLAPLARDRVAAGLIWLLAPLRRVKVPVDRFALRLVLVFDYLVALQQAHRDRPVTGGSRVRRVAASVSATIEATLERAENTPLPTLILTVPPTPPWRQWLLPLAAAGGFAAVRLVAA